MLGLPGLLSLFGVYAGTLMIKVAARKRSHGCLHFSQECIYFSSTLSSGSSCKIQALYGFVYHRQHCTRQRAIPDTALHEFGHFTPVTVEAEKEPLQIPTVLDSSR